MNIKNFLKHDFPASLTVFLVALPLCLGISLASGAPLFSGIVAGVVGGIAVGALSGSPFSVSGPAAGLSTVVALAILKLGSFEAFLLSIVVAGVIQIALGFARAGSIGHFFPASVVKGMLAAIGLILILKQVPHAFGYDVDFEGDESFLQWDGRNTFSEILEALSSLTPGAMVITGISLLILFLFENQALQQLKFFRLLPAPLIVVVSGIALNVFFSKYVPAIAIGEKHLVYFPGLSEPKSLPSLLTLPDFTKWQDPRIYATAVTIAIVASLETLLSIEACDKLDPHRRMTPLNRELKAQGVANTISGLLGGLPVTSVVVRSSANIYAGARTKASAITHGIVLLFSVLLIPGILRLIPLACLAGLLIAVGYKLTKPSVFQEMYRKGPSQFLPFVTTVVAVLFTDLLQGVFCGILVAVFFILKTNFHQSAILVNNGNSYLLKLTKDVSFLNRATLRNMFHNIPPNTRLIIDGSQSQFIDHDVKETIGDFIASSKARNILVELKNISLSD